MRDLNVGKQPANVVSLVPLAFVDLVQHKTQLKVRISRKAKL